MIEMEDVEKKRSRGRFLNLFDWSGKSRKKLFSSSSTSELSEVSNQEKQNAQKPSKSCLSLIEVDETGKSSTYNPRSDSSCSTSTLTSDDGQESRAPGVVARLMGLESLPVSNSLEPRFNPDFDPFLSRFSSRDAYDENMGYVNNGVSWDHLDSRMNHNRLIDRFKTEKLPPKSAKPVSVTRLLSPIRSPGFVQSRNQAYVMKVASRMIESSSPIAAKTRFSSSGSSSSSLPMKIRDLKEKLEASQRRPSSQLSNGTHNSKYLRGKHDEKRTTSSLKSQETNKLLAKSSSDGLKSKVKSPSPSVPAKVNTNLKQNISMPTSGNKGQKEKMKTKNRLIESSASTGKTVIKPNNQKSNNGVNKVLVENRTTSKRSGFTATPVEKNTTLSLSRKKNLPRNKNGVQEPGIIIKTGEKLKNCKITVNGRLKNGEDDQKKAMDVISFTFSSPIKGLSSDSQSSTKKSDQATESELSYNVISSDSLNTLLEQKLRELTSKIESSFSSLTPEEDSSGSVSKEWMNLDKVLSETSDCTSIYKNQTFQAEEQEVNSFSTVTEAFSNPWNESETELSESEEGHDWELEYITEIIASSHMGMTTDILPLSLFNELEDKFHGRGKNKRKKLFDFANQWLTLKCEQMFIGSCKGLLRKEILAEEVKKEIEELKKMRKMMTDELVYNDMSSFEGKWLNYKLESYEQGVEIVSELVDDLVNELLLCF